jgi:hypothetical protein
MMVMLADPFFDDRISWRLTPLITIVFANNFGKISTEESP